MQLHVVLVQILAKNCVQDCTLLFLLVHVGTHGPSRVRVPSAGACGAGPVPMSAPAVVVGTPDCAGPAAGAWPPSPQPGERV